MKAIVCEMCGSKNLLMQDGIYICQNCGTKYSPEEANKLIVEVSGSVSVDNSEKLQGYYELARRAASDKNYADAVKYYDLILQEDPNSWEAQFYSVNNRIYQSIVQRNELTDIPHKATLLLNTAKTVFEMISASAVDRSAEVEAGRSILHIFSEATSTLNALYYLLKAQDEKILFGFKDGFDYYFSCSKAISEALNRLTDTLSCYTFLIDKIDKTGFSVHSVTALQISNECLKDGWSQLSSVQTFYTLERLESEYNKILKTINENTNKIREVSRDYTPPEIWKPGKKGNCYIATAVYGSYDCPQVWTLRRYRDNVLAETRFGRVFIRTYYAVSPTLVKWFGATEWFRNLWKPTLDRMVDRLNNEGVECTPYSDKNW